MASAEGYVFIFPRELAAKPFALAIGEYDDFNSARLDDLLGRAPDAQAVETVSIPSCGIECHHLQSDVHTHLADLFLETFVPIDYAPMFPCPARFAPHGVLVITGPNKRLLCTDVTLFLTRSIESMHRAATTPPLLSSLFNEEY